MSKVKCYNCNHMGHFSRECTKPRCERKEQVNFAEGGTEETTLLLASLSTLTATTEAAMEHVMLNEERSQARPAAGDGGCDSSWFLDSGASNHISGRREIFSELDTGVRGSVRLGDGSAVQIEGRGTILFQCLNGEHLVLSDVYYIPRLCSNIVSLGQLDENAYDTHISQAVLQLRDPGGRLLARVQRNHGRLYVLSLSVARPVCLVVHGGEDAWLWHARYSHIGFQALRLLAREDMVRGLPVVDQADRLCEACLAGKHRRAPFPRQARYRAVAVLWHGHVDLCGPITRPPQEGNGTSSFSSTTRAGSCGCAC